MCSWQQWGSWRGLGPWRTEQHRMVFPWYSTETSSWAVDLQENPPKVTRIQTPSQDQPIRNQVRDYVLLHERKMPAGAKGGKRNVNELRGHRWNRTDCFSRLPQTTNVNSMSEAVLFGGAVWSAEPEEQQETAGRLSVGFRQQQLIWLTLPENDRNKLFLILPSSLLFPSSMIHCILLFSSHLSDTYHTAFNWRSHF